MKKRNTLLPIAQIQRWTAIMMAFHVRDNLRSEDKFGTVIKISLNINAFLARFDIKCDLAKKQR